VQVFGSESDISGGTFTSLVQLNNPFGSGGVNGSMRITGGNFSPSGIALYSGTVNLFGTGLTLSPIVGSTTNFTLAGTLLNGQVYSALPILIGTGGTVNLFNGGGTQATAFQPTGTLNNPGTPPSFTFTNAPSGGWFDPTPVDGYEFAINGSDTFTFATMPTGFASPFLVSVGGTEIGRFAGGETVNFASGTKNFVISGIDPTVDGDDPTVFPVRLGFSSSFASFSMTGIPVAGAVVVPEANTFALALSALGMVGAVVIRRKK
jgi:hypothetical protein